MHLVKILRGRVRTPRTRSDLRWAIADQAVSSASNILPVLIAALLKSDRELLATITVVGSLAMLQIDVVRAWVVLPLQIQSERTRSRVILRQSILVALPLTAVCAGAGLVLHRGWVVLAALLVPLVASYESIRALNVGGGSSRLILPWDVAWLAGSVASLCIGIGIFDASASWLVISWLGPAAVLGLLIGGKNNAIPTVAVGNPGFSIARRTRRLFVAEAALAHLGNLMPLALATIVSLEAAAVWAAARLMFRPIGMAANLLPIVIPPKLVDLHPSTNYRLEMIGKARELTVRIAAATAVVGIALSPAALALQVYRGLGLSSAIFWTVAVLLEYVLANAWTVQQILWKAMDQSRIAILLRGIALMALFAGMAISAWASTPAPSQMLTVVGLLAVLFGSHVFCENIRGESREKLR